MSDKIEIQFFFMFLAVFIDKILVNLFQLVIFASGFSCKRN